MLSLRAELGFRRGASYWEPSSWASVYWARLPRVGLKRRATLRKTTWFKRTTWQKSQRRGPGCQTLLAVTSASTTTSSFGAPGQGVPVGFSRCPGAGGV